jgi:hypothetical protein
MEPPIGRAKSSVLTWALDSSVTSAFLYHALLDVDTIATFGNDGRSGVFQRK